MRRANAARVRFVRALLGGGVASVADDGMYGLMGRRWAVSCNVGS
jgi:hypothetical protein